MKKERELRQALAKKKEQIQNLIDEGKTKEAQNLLEEAKDIQNQINLLVEARELEVPDPIVQNINPDMQHEEGEEQGQNVSETKAYRNAWFKAMTGREHELSAEEKTMLRNEMRENVRVANSLSSGSDKDGGYTVPKDISKEILQSIKEMGSVRNLVRIVPVSAPSGSRTRKKGTAGKLYNTAEKEQIKELKNMEFDQVEYKVKKFAGFMPAPSELLADSFVNFAREIVDWLSESALVTENEEVFYGTGGEKGIEGIFTTDKFNKIKAPSSIDIKFLRKVKNSVKKGYRKNAKWVMNTEAFELVSNIEDKNGRGILAPDPREEDLFNLFGRPVEVYDEIHTDDKTNKTHIAFGDFQRAYSMFDRQKFEVKSTDEGGDAFLTDQTYFRGIERFDGKVMDEEAAVIVTDVLVGESATIPEDTK
ncbi:phage major capsid protein [Bacillus cytotoxicus]|uniref:phage major capsid protein n=1 Tax=Bacillus cytotoxicus TaxID=580165 RepID=UPI001AEEF598|nr:phage major capsid protein [Bacillus cytotoxicus]QTR79152.1 phage major capsid protein [Bacillus cytotoxicus]